MDCAEVLFSGHIMRRMFERGIEFDDVLAVIRSGEVIEDYPDDLPFASFLLLGRRDLRPFHVVVGRDSATGRCFAVTVYEPRPGKWSPDFRRRLTL